MASTPVYMPKYGMTMTEAYLVEWHFSEGDYVEVGQPLITIETEKANAEVEAPASGYLTGVRFQADEDVSVGEILAYLAESKEDLNPDRLESAATPLPVDSIADVAIEDAPIEPQKSAATEGIPFEGMRKQIAESMHSSLANTAQYTITRDLVVDTLADYKAGLDGISFNDFFIRALAFTVRDHPAVRQQLVDDKLFEVQAINIGIAVAIDHGLVVPVIKNVDKQDLQQIAAERKRLIQRAREDALDMADTTNGVCTLSNLGTYDIDTFTPVLNPPETVILGLGRILQRPWVEGGQLSVKHVLHLSLTADHRILDGANAAEFLRSFCNYLQSPEKIDAR
jgi:pyruvate dehydrogenase E2 component (dihydrolipoamide acetyltransferase)